MRQMKRTFMYLERLGFTLCLISAASWAFAQSVSKRTGFASTTKPVYVDSPSYFPEGVDPNQPLDPNLVLDVRIVGNDQVGAKDIIQIIRTRQGRPFNEGVLEEDKRSLMQKGWFIDVKPKVERTPAGYIVTFQFIERPLLHYIKTIGNFTHTKKALLEEAGIEPGAALDPIAVHQAKERMEQLYRDSGYYRVHLDVLSGDQIGDRGAVFQISEGEKQRVLDVDFVGCTVTTGNRLKTQIQSKPGWFLWINSEFTRKQLDEDVESLKTFYRKLGFFYAKIDRKFVETAGYTGFGKPRNWVKVVFIIEEGPRCRVRDVRFSGNKIFSDDALYREMKLPKERYYNQDMLEADMARLKEKYGKLGHVFAMAEPDPRLDDDFVDLVVNVHEGPCCFTESISVEIAGNDGTEPYTRMQPIMNRLSIRPGEVLRTTDINNSKRRIIASQIFNANPSQGQMPEIIFEYPQAAIEEEEREMQAAGSSTFRGQPSDIMTEEEWQEEQAMQKFAEFFRVRPPKQPQPAVQPPPSRPPQNDPNQAIYRGQSPTAFTPVQTTPAPAVYTNTAGYASAPVPYGSLSLTDTGPYGPTTYTPPALQANQTPAPISIQVASTDMPGYQQVGGAAAYNLGTVPSPTTGTAPGSSSVVYRGVDIGDSAYGFDPGAPTGKIYPTPVTIKVQETRTGQLMMSVAVSSDAGLMGRFVIEEQNFDATRFPRGWRLSDWKNAFRGKGQRFRIEAVPGTQVQRYEVSWQTPYLFDLDYSFGVSGYYYQRFYDEWYEDRLGGTVSVGKLWTQDFSTSLIFRGEQVNIYNMRFPPDDMADYNLYDVLGKHPMYSIGLNAAYNTRDSEYIPTEGHLVSGSIEQVFGDYQFLRGGIDLRKYFTLHERADRSGRWVLGLRSSLSVTEGGTPIYERYYAGGFTNLRGFEFRGVTPRTPNDFGIGGCMEFYNSAELVFPITADDMIRGSIFVDTGTIETSITDWRSKYRVAVGFGLRLTIPMMGPAPIALDFAFPLSKDPGDIKQLFSFNVGFMR